MLDRSDLLHFTLHTVMHNLTEGMILVSVILFCFCSMFAPPSSSR
jgi:heavy metal efflux system protein